MRSDSRGYNIWTFNGNFWNVPNVFELPKKAQRRRGWELWLKGMDTPDEKKRARSVCLQMQHFLRLFSFVLSLATQKHLAHSKNFH